MTNDYEKLSDTQKRKVAGILSSDSKLVRVELSLSDYVKIGKKNRDKIIKVFYERKGVLMFSKISAKGWKHA